MHISTQIKNLAQEETKKKKKHRRLIFPNDMIKQALLTSVIKQKSVLL